ncbi:MAG: GTPase ObgE [Candidatus Omnitrophica bacterium CG07_land_8_20_14_0_80_42_15]|uniref:GTPase Obg n=1 Tax=Candidatus Aquitaenariimonas noxiae TaxID=1974741 RepID=A0A2J0KSN0_9BACT|nr:MAG: GTPase ObgE [Candidatus Omnitrophica bacterium CG07_land_8_20_14_0_80_42_15]
MFIDRAKIAVKAGNGGDGCNSFYRDKRTRYGPPDGGDGGDGGNIIFEANQNLRTLYDFKYNRHFKAQRGGHGSSNNKKGKRGESLLVKVPPGTIIIDNKTGLILRDLAEPLQQVILCKGGRGGKGNSRGREATKGEAGEEKEVVLELKIIADVGIIGYPNVGKSTFISKVSSAKSKIAPYPFTTKSPILGVVKRDEDRMTLADMPGIIEGAHTGRGLGDQFLRHIERTKFLVHFIDMAAFEGRDPASDYEVLNNELKLYSKDLIKKPQVLVANKMDMPGTKNNLKKFKKVIKKKIYPISALTGEGTKQLLNELFRKMKKYG